MASTQAVGMIGHHASERDGSRAIAVGLALFAAVLLAAVFTLYRGVSSTANDPDASLQLQDTD